MRTVRLLALIAATGLCCAVLAPGADAQMQAAPVSFSGSCQVAGPIVPSPPITVVPKPGSRFSYHGSGTCVGTLSGPITLVFEDVATVFDTCELGPDSGLAGVAEIGAGRARARFAITIDLARLALAGPFLLTSGGGGLAEGLAQFAPANTATAPQDCASAGIGSATLTASFQTVSPLVGVADPAVGASMRPSKRRHRRGRGHRHRRGCHRRSRCSHHER